MNTNNGEITGALGINLLSNFLDKILSSNLQFKSMETKIAKIFCLFLKFLIVKSLSSIYYSYTHSYILGKYKQSRKASVLHH